MGIEKMLRAYFQPLCGDWLTKLEVDTLFDTQAMRGYAGIDLRGSSSMPAALLAVRQNARTFDGDEKVAHADAGHIGVQKRPETIAKYGGVEWPVAARRGPIDAMAPNGVKGRCWATRDSRPGAGGSSLLDAGESYHRKHFRFGLDCSLDLPEHVVVLSNALLKIKAFKKIRSLS